MMVSKAHKRTPEDSRQSLRDLLDRLGWTPNKLASEAGFRSSTLYNFLLGRSDSLSLETVEKIAKAARVSIAEVLGNATEATVESIPLKDRVMPLDYMVGPGGKLHQATGQVVRLAVSPPANDLRTALVDLDALHPIPEGWVLAIEAKPSEPDSLIDEMATVTFKGGGRDAYVKLIRPGSRPGLFTLDGLGCAPIRDVAVESARRVIAVIATPFVSIAQA